MLKVGDRVKHRVFGGNYYITEIMTDGYCTLERKEDGVMEYTGDMLVNLELDTDED